MREKIGVKRGQSLYLEGQMEVISNETQGGRYEHRLNKRRVE